MPSVDNCAFAINYGGGEAHRRSTHSPRFCEQIAATNHRRHRFLLALSGVSHRRLVSKLDCSSGARASARRGRLLLRPLTLDSCSRVGCILPVLASQPRRIGGSLVATTANNWQERSMGSKTAAHTYEQGRNSPCPSSRSRRRRAVLCHCKATRRQAQAPLARSPPPRTA